MAERGVEVDHSTINRWVLKFAPELDKRLRPHLSLTKDSWRVDKTDIEVKGEWKYRVYRNHYADVRYERFTLIKKAQSPEMR